MPQLRAQPAPDEYQVKAAFLFHFAQLVDWPEGTLNATDRSLVLCLYNGDPKAPEIRHIVEGKPLGSRFMRIREVSGAGDLGSCNLLFLSSSEARRQTQVLQSLRGQPVLTVGETDDFLSAGGIIRFHFESSRIRFDVNLAAANKANLKISSRLLVLASSVIGESDGKGKG